MADFKKVIAEVLTKAHKESELKKMGMKDGEPIQSYKMTYDAPTAQLEPIYYWILDFLPPFASEIEKVTDNFTSSPGSGHFSDMQQKESRMRNEAMTILGGLNQITKSILNLVYDLKDFEQRLKNYEQAKSDNKDTKEAAIMSLKQIWLDNVDMKKGNTGLKAMSFSQYSFATLLDAFMMIKDESLKGPDGKELDLNDRVKRILKQRIVEFNNWVKLSEKEIKKRFKIEKSYLKSQVETLKLYTRWARPYLQSASKLNMKGFENDPALVNAFSTTRFQLTLFGKKQIKLQEAAKEKDVPQEFANVKTKRDYFSCIVVDFQYRGFLRQVDNKGNYASAFGGKVDMKFDCYALNSDEIEAIKSKFEKDDIEDTLNFFQGATDQALEELKDDIEKYTSDKDEEEEEKKEKKEQDINPFKALAEIFMPSKWGSKKKDDKKEGEKIKPEDIKKDSWQESYARKLAQNKAVSSLYTIYDIYKKAHGMASAPGEGFDINESDLNQ